MLQYVGSDEVIMARAVKWVHDVIPDTPYAITENFRNKLFNEITLPMVSLIKITLPMVSLI